MSHDNTSLTTDLNKRGGFSGGENTGAVAFAGVLLIMVGLFHAIQGLVALFNDSVYLVGPKGLVINVDYTAWGWIHLIGGIIVVLAGVALFAGKMWARILAVIVAVISAIINVVFLPAYPIWSTMMIAIDVLVIWAVTVHGSEMKSYDA